MRVRIDTKPVEGLDGVVYHVLTVIGTGRGWHGRCLYAAGGPVALTGKVVESRDHGKGTELAVRLDDAGVLVQEFTERPYVSKRTGVRNPHIPTEFNDPRPLAGVYGLLGTTGWFREVDTKPLDAA